MNNNRILIKKKQKKKIRKRKNIKVKNIKSITAKEITGERTQFQTQRADLDLGQGLNLLILNKISKKRNKKRKILAKMINNLCHLQNRKKQISSILFLNFRLFKCKIKTINFFNLKGDLSEKRFLKRS